MDDWRETELNPRQPMLFANRVATYSHTDGTVSIRFLYARLLAQSKLNDHLDTLEIVNVSEVTVTADVAERMLVDIATAISQTKELQVQMARTKGKKKSGANRPH